MSGPFLETGHLNHMQHYWPQVIIHFGEVLSNVSVWSITITIEAINKHDKKTQVLKANVRCFDELSDILRVAIGKLNE